MGKIVTVGDSLSEGYGMMLPGILKKEGSGWSSSNHGVRGSGLVSKAPIDWEKELPLVMKDEQPDVVVVSLGTNDIGRNITKDGRTLRYGSDEWAKEYSTRLDRTLDVIGASGAKVVWMPMPTFGKESLEKDSGPMRELQDKVCRRRNVFVGSVAGSQSSEFKQPDGVHYNGRGYLSAVSAALAQSGMLAMNGRVGFSAGIDRVPHDRERNDTTNNRTTIARAETIPAPVARQRIDAAPSVQNAIRESIPSSSPYSAPVSAPQERPVAVIAEAPKPQIQEAPQPTAEDIAVKLQFNQRMVAAARMLSARNP